MSNKKILKCGQIHECDKSESGNVYLRGGCHQPSYQERTDTQSDMLSYRYALTQKISYCLDANYYKGTTIDTFFKKHKRQLVIEQWQLYKNDA